MVAWLSGLGSWCWILAIWGFGTQHLAVRTPFLAYTNEAVLPFYVMHQTVLLAIGYFVVQRAIPDLLKFLVSSPLGRFVSGRARIARQIRAFLPIRVLIPPPGGAA
jgi:hypothetical protein